MSNILCIENEPAVGILVERSLGELGYRSVLTQRLDEALRVLQSETFDLILADDRLSDATGPEVLRSLRDAGHDVPVIIMADYSSVEDAVQSIRLGAMDYLTKPLRLEALRLAVSNAVEVARLRKENDDFRRQIDGRRGTVVGQHVTVTSLLETIAAVAPTRAAILLEGESGTGKELFARAIHQQSPRRAAPFITVNCAAMPEGLVESTLFGHERGAFTGANARFLGAFERAHLGTLLLDEISEMRLDLQAKLLRAIQEQEFERVGGSQSIKVDVRIVATTNRDLLAEVEAGRFRRDLYYRLSVVPIRTPALRDRLDDMPLLVEHLARQSASQLGVRTPEVAPEAIELLRARSWPGNVRELANVVERAVILCRGGRLTPELFREAAPSSDSQLTVGVAPPPIAAAAPAVVAASGASDAPEKAFDLDELEKITIQRALEFTRGNRTRAARLLGISERTLRTKLNTRPPVLAMQA